MANQFTPIDPKSELYETLDVYIDMLNGKGFSEVIAFLATDKEFNLHNKEPKITPKGAVRSFMIEKYNLDAKVVRFIDYGKDINTEQPFEKNSKITKLSSILDYAKSKMPGNEKFVEEVFYQVSASEIREYYLKKQIKKLAFPNGSGSNSEVRKKLNDTYSNFHKNNLHPSTVSYNTRLGVFYYQIGLALKDTEKAQEFIQKNFGLLVQPTKDEYKTPDKKQIAAAIKAAAKINADTESPGYKEDYYQMADCYLKNQKYEGPVEEPITVKSETEKLKVISPVVTPSILLPENKSDIVITNHTVAIQLDDSIRSVGGIDNVILLLEEMKKTGLTALQYTQKAEERRMQEEQAKKIKDMLDNLPQEMRTTIIASYLPKAENN